MTRSDPNLLRELAARADAICAAGHYVLDASRVHLADHLATCRAGTVLITPGEWDAIEQQARGLCHADAPLAAVRVTNESTMAALQRLAVRERLPNIAALNFASARNPGGGYRNGALAQEETLARSSGLVPTLEQSWTYYDQNRKQDSLLYTDHAIWSPRVPFFADDAGTLLPAPYLADVITMPAPNAGAMRTESDLLGVIPTFQRRIRWIMALAVTKQVQHLVLGAWGCGAFGNQPDLVARLFREALAPDQPWRHGVRSVTFAIIDHSKRRASLAAFEAAFAEMTHQP